MGKTTLLVTSFAATLSGSLLWTGFPVFLSQTIGGKSHLSEIYAYATFGTLLFGLIGGVLSDVWNSKCVSILSALLSASILAFIFAIFPSGLRPAPENELREVLFLLPPLYFSLSLSASAEWVWLLRLSETLEEHRNTVLDRSSVTMLAKLIGFAAGPLFFEALSIHGALVCAVAYFSIACCQTLIRGVARSEEIRKVVEEARVSIRILLNLARSPALVLTALLTGTLSVPLNVIFASLALKLGTATDVSVFWGLAGAASLANLVFQRMGWLQFEPKGVIPSTALMGTCLIAALTSSHVASLIAFAAIYVFFSMLYSSSLYLEIGTSLRREGLGARFGLLNLIIDAGVFVGMTGGSALSILPTSWMLGTLVALLIARGIATQRLFTVTEPQSPLQTTV